MLLEQQNKGQRILERVSVDEEKGTGNAQTRNTTAELQSSANADQNPSSYKNVMDLTDSQREIYQTMIMEQTDENSTSAVLWKRGSH